MGTQLFPRPALPQNPELFIQLSEDMNTISAMMFFRIALGVLFVGALLPLTAWRNNRLANILGVSSSVIGSLCGLTASLSVLLVPLTVQHYTARTTWFDFSLALDGLAVFFVTPVMLLTACTAVYGFRSLDLPAQGLQAGRHWFGFNLLAVSMLLVLTAANSLFFIIFWEIMALSSFLLVISDLKDAQARSAGWTYLVATHIGTALLLFLFLYEYQLTGSFDFAGFFRLQKLPTEMTLLFFFLGFAGLGIKAGLFPFHVWLPQAHASAPSHVSALMSGVMIKTAVYTFLRLVTFLPLPPAWCSLTVTAFGIFGAIFGILMASMQTDIKRCLAYSSIENIGIIFMGIGVWLYCVSVGLQIPAILALVGALFHIWNHSLFKGLLFMGVGSMVHGANTREMTSMGGLLHRMPMTGGLIILGGGAISALPPLNGLVGELLIYLALLFACLSLPGGMSFIFMLLIILLAAVGALTLLTMTRLIGITLAGEPRSNKSFQAHESPAEMLAAMTIPALFCLFIGIFPQAVIGLVAAPLAVLAPNAAADFAAMTGSLPFGALWSIMALSLVGLLLYGFARYHYQEPATKRIPTWGCGFIKPDARLEYSAGSFSQYAQETIYCSCLRPAKTESSKKPPLFPVAMQSGQQNTDLVLARFVSPLFVRCAEIANACRRLQAGQLGIYLSYFFITTIILLGWAVLSYRG